MHFGGWTYRCDELSRAGARGNSGTRTAGGNVEQLGESQAILLVLNFVSSDSVGQLIQSVHIVLTSRLDPNTVTRTRSRRRDTTRLLSPRN
jgi:hypothetical protein